MLLKDILDTYDAQLPQNANAEILFPFLRKLHTAIIYTHRTLVLGSNNKMSDYEQGAAKCIQEKATMRRSTLNYYPIFKEHTLSLPSFVNPLIKAEKIRVGNCEEQAYVLASYLWRFADKIVHRIEIVNTKDFDHVFVIVNRKKGSKLSRPNDWGEDCWIVDPWAKEQGIFYHAQKFHEKIINVFSYLMEQYEWFEKNSKFKTSLFKNKLILNQYRDNFQKNLLRVPMEVLADIDIFSMPYPLDKNSRISDLYETVDPSKKIKHKEYFNPCLEEIKACNGTPKKFVKNKK